MKLFPKLALTIGAVILTLIGSLGLTFYWREEQALRAQSDQDRRTVLKNLVLIAQEAFLTNDDLLLIKYTGWLQKWNPSVTSASVVDMQGEVLAHSEPARIGKNAVTPDPIHAQVLVLSEAVFVGNHVIATASVGFSEKILEQTFRERRSALQKKIALLSGSALGIGFVIAFVITLSWTRPIRILDQAAERIGQGKYHLELETLPTRQDELGRFSRTFQRMAIQLQELDQMKEDFVSAVTHELRSPLGAIESYLNVIDGELAEGIPDATWRTYLERLRLNTQRLNRFVNDLLDVAALDRGKVTLDRKPVSLGPLIQDVLAFFGPKMAERSLVIRTDIGPNVPVVLADDDKIRQVLTNLLSNAIKFTPVKGTIEIGVQAIDDLKRIRVYVQDSGVGISEDDQKRIFNKFEQAISSRTTIKGPKGTGLGLPICRALVELHSGIIGVRSTPGEGSRFFFTLPVTEKTAVAATPMTGGLV